MQTRTKLVWLEMVAGLLGWVWIVASIVLLYFLAMAIFNDGSWSRVGWAFGVGVIAKWLTRGFSDSKRRVAFEADLMAQGWSREDAQKEWLSRYMGTKPGE